MPNTKDKLTPKQSKFVAEYLANGMNATKAAISAGYSASSAEVEGSRLLRNAKVAAAVAKKTEKHMAQLDYGVDKTLEYIARMAFFDPKDLFEDDGSLKQIKDIPEEARTVIAGLEVSEICDAATGEQKHAIGLLKKVKLSDRKAALDMLMRYHSLYKDKVEVNVSEELASALSNARKRIGR